MSPPWVSIAYPLYAKDDALWLDLKLYFYLPLCRWLWYLDACHGPSAWEGIMKARPNRGSIAKTSKNQMPACALALVASVIAAPTHAQTLDAGAPSPAESGAAGTEQTPSTERPDSPPAAKENKPEGSVTTGGSVELSTGGAVSNSGKAESVMAVPSYAGKRASRPQLTVSERFEAKSYMQRYLPESHLFEIGMFTGILFPSGSHNLKVPELPPEEYSSAAMLLGGHFAYYPLPYLGAEVEGYGGGGSTKDTKFSAVFYSVRAHVIAQLPMYSVIPFVLVGGGILGAASESMGHDRDPAFHFGAGVKAPINHIVSGRFDIRDVMTQKGLGADNGAQTHHPELHLGLTFTFERTVPPAPRDQDFDGLYDSEDKCPQDGALTLDGCPSDRDQDGILDRDDQCPAEAGLAPTGCPDRDKDRDGVPTPADQCPEEAGPAPSGCPVRDEDGDGFIGDNDKCPTKAETRNGFEDDDGCPDEMPEAVKRFTGVIQGVNFKQGTADIEKASFPTLDSAVEILIQYKSIRLEVSGHTSSEGGEKRNLELSNERAEAVRGYFVDKGVGPERVVARGAGASEPIADNESKAGRSQNRRIEFRILSQK